MREQGEAQGAAADPQPGRLSAATGRPIGTLWLFVLLVYVHLGYYGFRHPWAAAVAGLGLLSAILVWGLRGPAWSLRWFVCLWGAIEGLQIFVCQLSWNWHPVKSDAGICEAYTGWPLLWWGLWVVAILASRFATEKSDGR